MSLRSVVTGSSAAPRLRVERRPAIFYRGGHLLIIDFAGSVKIEVVTQRVAATRVEGVESVGSVAFTTTQRPDSWFKSRIERHIGAHPKLSPATLDRIGGTFVGTIDSYGVRILQPHVSRDETTPEVAGLRWSAAG